MKRLHNIFFFILAVACVTAPQAHASTKVTYFHNDATGTPVAASNEAGEVIWRKVFRPFGSELDDGGAIARDNTIGYTGHRFDSDLDLVYAGARYYDPMIGRFLSMDPVGFRQGSVHSFNKYAYGNNNPYRYTDPDGNIPVETVWDIFNVGIGVVSLGTNLASGNFIGAAEDAVGVIIDVGAVLTPYVPGGAGSAIKAKRAAEAFGDVARGPTLNVSRAKTPEIAKNIENAISQGAPTALNRVTSKAQIRQNRRAALRGQQSAGPGKSLDEFPFASCAQGGAGACVRAVPAHEQNIQGGELSQFFRRNNIGDSDAFNIKVVD